MDSTGRPRGGAVEIPGEHRRAVSNALTPLTFLLLAVHSERTTCVQPSGYTTTMKQDLVALAANRSNVDLVASLQVLAARGREDAAAMVAHVAEIERRRIPLAEGYGSLFTYCRVALRLSEHEAYNRVVAAEAAPRFPAILDGLVDGSLNLTTVRLLAPHLTPENHRDVLARASGRSKREVEALVASLAPQPDIPPSIHKLPGPSHSLASAGEAIPLEALTRLPSSADPCRPLALTPGPDEAPADPLVPLARTAPRPVVAPLSPTRYRVQFTVGAETYEELRLAQDLLRREIPDGDPGAIFARAVKLLLAQVAKEKTAATATPRPAPPSDPGSRHIPATVKRAVWRRDRGQCAFVARGGRRCAERAYLELHHIQPFALGGDNTASNIALRCRGHNAYEAELDFGSRVRGAGIREADVGRNAS